MPTSGSWSKAIGCVTAESQSNSTYRHAHTLLYGVGWEGTEEEILLIMSKLDNLLKKLIKKLKLRWDYEKH